MTNWQELLRDADSATEALSEHEAQAIRRLVVSAAREPRSVSVWWPRPIAVAAIAILVIASGGVGRRLVSGGARPAAPSAAPAASDERRQLQFATPGGTRIIWTFNPEFNLKETNP